MTTLRLGSPLFGTFDTPADWLDALKARGYRAAYCPLPLEADEATAAEWGEAAGKAGIVIAEVGAWSNPLSPDDQERSNALEKCKAALLLAERIGANCAVNICGSRSAEKWDGPCAADYDDDAFGLAVDMAREIIDSVQPRRAAYTLEPMPWMTPDSPEQCLELLRAVERPAFGVHMDVVNWIVTPRLHYRNAEFTRHCFDLLGPHVRSIHAKDTVIEPRLTCHLSEGAPGTGNYDFSALFEAVAKTDPDLPILLEHLQSEEEYDAAAAEVRKQAEAAGYSL